jgi:PBP1b-binding outer membrane lipoprotein LpoB
MRVLAIMALTLLLAGCNGDRMKQGMNMRQAQPQTTGLLT